MDAAHAAPVHTMVVGVFDDPAHARTAVEDLRRAGFGDDLIGFHTPSAGTLCPAEENIDWIARELAAGKSLVTVHEADERAEDAREVLRRHHGEIHEPSDIGTYGTGLPATPY
jgi:hypothetical protein